MTTPNLNSIIRPKIEANGPAFIQHLRQLAG